MLILSNGRSFYLVPIAIEVVKNFLMLPDYLSIKKDSPGSFKQMG